MILHSTNLFVLNASNCKHFSIASSECERNFLKSESQSFLSGRSSGVACQLLWCIVSHCQESVRIGVDVRNKKQNVGALNGVLWVGAIIRSMQHWKCGDIQRVGKPTKWRRFAYTSRRKEEEETVELEAKKEERR